MKLLEGKKALVLGLANERSIAWGITRALKSQGAHIGLTYLNQALYKRVKPLSEEIQADFTVPMDVTKEEDFPQLSQTVKDHWGEVDIVIHSLAFAQSEDLRGRFCQTSRAGFSQAMDISAYSLIALTREMAPLMPKGGSVLALTYHGSQVVVKNYNVMGVAKAALEASMRYLAWDMGESKIRVNCISAGPIKTLSASGVSGFRSILKNVEEVAPLKRNITSDEVGQAALFLSSSLSSGITGQTLYVDAGHSIMGHG